MQSIIETPINKGIGSFCYNIHECLCIFEGKKQICHDPRRIEEFGSIAADTLRVRGSDHVDNIVKRMHDSFGLIVRIRDRRFGQKPPDSLPLYVVRDAPRPGHNMEPLKKEQKK